MALVVTKNWLIEMLFLQGQRWNQVEELRIGLFQNNWTPDMMSTIDDVVPADFSGYDGLRVLNQWLPQEVVWEEPRAILLHAPVVWTAVGLNFNNIFGFYVVGDTQQLWWAERNTLVNRSVGRLGQTYKVTPRYARRGEDP